MLRVSQGVTDRHRVSLRVYQCEEEAGAEVAFPELTAQVSSWSEQADRPVTQL